MKHSGLLHLQCPVTALGFCDSYVVAAQGPGIVLFEIKSRNTSLLENVIRDQAIHGIRLIFQNNDASYYFVWGGRYGRFIVIKPSTAVGKHILEVASNLYYSPDWILDAATPVISPDENDHKAPDRIALVTGHNALVLLYVHYTESRQISFTEAELSEASRILLYCARISWVNEQYILVSSGTALGQIIIWSCVFSPQSKPGLGPATTVLPLYSFDAHDGSVFGVDPVFFKSAAGDILHLILCSCSDDRTIRIWDIKPRFSSVQTDYSLSSQLPSAILNTNEGEPTDTPRLLGKTWAHSSRIWDIKSFGYSRKEVETSRNWHQLSFGEDASLQSWEMELSEHGRLSIRHLETFTLHSGKSIWSYAISNLDDETLLVATGGADGAVVLTRLGQKGENECFSNPGSDVPAGPLNSIFESRDKVKTYSFCHSNNLIVTTHRGRVLIATNWNDPTTVTSNPEMYICQDLGIYEELDGYSLTTGIPDIGAAFVANSTGEVYCYHPNGMFSKMLSVKSKVTGLYTYTSNNQPAMQINQEESFDGNKIHYLLVATFGASEILLHGFEANDKTLREQQHILLKVAQNSLVTSFSAFCDGPELIVMVGFRSGSLSIYQVLGDDLSHSSLPNPVKPVLTHQCHEDAVTVILAEPDPGNTKALNVLTTGRDSYFSIHEVSLARDAYLRTIHKATIPLGPFIEGAYVRPRDQHLLFYGFKSTDFVIYDETEKQVLSAVDCGGAHRVWAYHYDAVKDPVSTSGTFAWSRSGQVNSLVIPQSKGQILRRGAHGREIKSCASSIFDYDPSTGLGSGLIATAAEDTDIRLYECRSTSAGVKVECVNIIRKHNTGVQHLEFGSDGSYMFSCGSSEEFFVWKLRRAPFVSLGIICEAILPPISELPDLRIMDFKVSVGSESLDPPKDDPIFRLTMVFSDSTIRTYDYSYENKFQLLAVGSYGTSCLAQVDEVYLSPNAISDQRQTLGRSTLITGGTDGHLMLWRTHTASKDETPVADPSSLEVFRRYKIHQNTIKSLITFPFRIDGNTFGYVFFTGGDDNAIGVTRFDCHRPELKEENNISRGNTREKLANNEDDEYSLSVNSVLIPRAHAASVSSLQITGKEIKERVHEWTLISVGNDQRLKAWGVRIDFNKPGVESIEIKKLGNEYTSIADVADTCLLPADNLQEHGKAIVICGVGMEIRSTFKGEK